MTVYQFDGPASLPYYSVDRFLRHGPASPAGHLAQGSSAVPCLVIRDGKPITDEQGTPYVGFTLVIDAQRAEPASAAHFEEVDAQRRAMTVPHHHCPDDTHHVIDVRRLYALGKPPHFDPPRAAPGLPETIRAVSELDAIVRRFHDSEHCGRVNLRLMGRRAALKQAWSAFITANPGRWSDTNLRRARNLDFVMRTAIYEGHLDRGCNAYGACERNVIALSIRNRARERCLRGQGCSFEGDFEGVATATSQYNIWDEYLTQTSGLTSCFLRPDLADVRPYAKLQAIYTQSVADAERILFGAIGDLAALFPENDRADLLQLRNYYHPPAMGKCFPHHKRIEYMSGAVARKGGRFALIANTYIEVGARRDGGYSFKQVVVDTEDEGDVVSAIDRYPGWIVDGRKVALNPPARCTPYGVSRRCRFEQVRRHRRTPAWLETGKPVQLTCRVRARSAECGGDATPAIAQVGGTCDTSMQPMAGVR